MSILSNFCDDYGDDGHVVGMMPMVIIRMSRFGMLIVIGMMPLPEFQATTTLKTANI
jgi:hypothetical protein